MESAGSVVRRVALVLPLDPLQLLPLPDPIAPRGGVSVGIVTGKACGSLALGRCAQVSRPVCPPMRWTAKTEVDCAESTTPKLAAPAAPQYLVVARGGSLPT